MLGISAEGVQTADQNAHRLSKQTGALLSILRAVCYPVGRCKGMPASAQQRRFALLTSIYRAPSAANRATLHYTAAKRITLLYRTAALSLQHGRPRPAKQAGLKRANRSARTAGRATRLPALKIHHVTARKISLNAFVFIATEGCAQKIQRDTKPRRPHGTHLSGADYSTRNNYCAGSDDASLLYGRILEDGLHTDHRAVGHCRRLEITHAPQRNANRG